LAPLLRETGANLGIEGHAGTFGAATARDRRDPAFAERGHGADPV